MTGGFANFVSDRQRPLLRFAMVLTGDTRLAEDIVADVLARAFERWDHIAGVAQPNAYVRKMVVNEFLSRRRKRARTVSVADIIDLADQAGYQPDVAHSHAERAAMLDRLARLPRKQRLVLALRYYEGLADGDIAQLLGCAEGTVRSHASRGLAALRIELRQPRLTLVEES